MDDTVVITLFRHGVTVANKRKAYLGWTDSPLLSKMAALNTSDVIGAGLVYASDLNRCSQTAAQFFPEKTIRILKELREMNFGGWEGRTYEELKNDKKYLQWLEYPFEAIPPNGERYHDFVLRIEKGWEQIKKEIANQQVNSAAIVTHAGVIRYLLTKYGSIKKSFWDWYVPHGAGWELTFKSEKYRRGERCTLLQEVPIMENPTG
jgi:alpha-ribazole phosphatase